MSSREEFEESARLDHDFEDDDFRMMSNGGYYWGPTQMIWETWQSARQCESDLISADPDLLEAAQLISDALEKFICPLDIEFRALQKARAAIAKARGEK